MNTIGDLGSLVLRIRTQPTELTIYTKLSQGMIMGDLVSGGYGVGGSMEGVLLRPLAVQTGYALGSNVDGHVTHYMESQGGYTLGGSANLVMLDYADGFSDGYSMGGKCAAILTRIRYMTEADPMKIADLDSMMISDIEFITLE